MNISKIRYLIAGLLIGCISATHAQNTSEQPPNLTLGAAPSCSPDRGISWQAIYVATETADVNMMAIAQVDMTSPSGWLIASLNVEGGIACPDRTKITGIDPSAGSALGIATSQCIQHVVAGNTYTLIGQSRGSNSNAKNVCLSVLAQ
jgi:hypothetical protein